MRRLFILMASMLMSHSFIASAYALDKGWAKFYIFSHICINNMATKHLTCVHSRQYNLGVVRGKKN